MHYYQFNIGDYRKDTGHLTPIEHYIYRTLIDWYYLDETPIPKETQVVIRRLSLDFSLEQNLLNVLQDFFVLGEKGWEHKRINIDLIAYHEQCTKNANNGKLGGRPKKTQVVSTDNPNESEIKPNQEPLTTNPKPITTTMSLPATPKADNVPYEAILTLYHEKLPKNPRVVQLSTKRKAHIAARWKSGLMPDLQSWGDYFDSVNKSDFLKGLVIPNGERKRFIADIDWLINENNIIKVAEGKYHGS